MLNELKTGCKHLSDGPDMQFGDWANAVFNIVFGAVLGVLAFHLIALATSGYWIVALIIAVAFVGLFLVDALLDGL